MVRPTERYLEPALYGVFAIFAFVTAMVTHLGPHRVWGWFAGTAYAIGAVVAIYIRGRSRLVLAGAVLAGAVLLPLLVLVLSGQGQPEVAVVERSGAQLLQHATPYLSPDQLAGAHYEAYNPYLPGMALFGLPRALAGIDARLVFAGVFIALLAVSARLLGGGDRARQMTLLSASPLVALPAVVGGDDLPVIGLVLAGLALAGRDRPGAAGLVLGIAGVLKATAWPALVVGLAVVAVRERGAWRRYAAAAAGPLALGILVPLLVDPDGLMENAVAFPLGLAGVASPADSPLPGHLLAATGAYGHAAAVFALGLTAVAVGVSLLVRPPADARAAALRLALGLLLATALMPATRWGYLAYPAVLAVWARFAAQPQPATVIRLPVRKEEPWLAA